LLEPAITACLYHQLVRCAGCGHYSIAPDAIEIVANRTFQLEYFGDSFAGRAGPFVDLYESWNCRRILGTLRLAGPARILEIGPGSGALMARLHAREHEVFGLDLSLAVSAAIEKRYGLVVECESLEQHLERVGPERYDLIIICHALEHFADPVSALGIMMQLVRRGGMIYLAVPNMDSWHGAWSGWIGYAPYHLHYFGFASMDAALARAGFSVLRRKSYESLSGWPNTVYRTLGRRRQKAGLPPDDPQPKAGWQRTLLELARLGVGVALSPMRWLQSALGRGEELVVLAERKST
jgi:SAM-dependent methyltransferase